MLGSDTEILTIRGLKPIHKFLDRQVTLKDGSKTRFKYKWDFLWKLETESGISILTTEDHYWYISGRQRAIRTANLTKGLIFKNGVEIIKSVQDINEVGRVYYPTTPQILLTMKNNIVSKN
jgi:hypothetical protein